MNTSDTAPQATVAKGRYAVLDEAAFDYGYAVGGVLLGVPVVLTTCLIPLLISHSVAGDTLLLLFCGMLWVALPGCAALSAAMSACPPASVIEERDTRPATESARAVSSVYGRTMLIPAIMGLCLMGYYVFMLGHYALLAGRPLSQAGLRGPLDMVGAIVVSPPFLRAGCWAGSRLGERARRDQGSRLARVLGRCWSGCRSKWQGASH